MGNAKKFLSEQHFFEIFKRNDIIMNPDKKGKPGMRPITTAPVFSLEGLRVMLEEIHADGLDGWGNPQSGQLPAAREALKAALAEWDGFSVRTGKDPKKPSGRFLENINRAKAKVEFLCAKSRKLNNLIDAADKKAKDREASKWAKKGKKHKLVGSYRRNSAGQIVWCDGRSVVNGKFEDNGEEVEAYLQNIKKQGQAESKRLYKKEKERVAKMVGVMPAL